MTHPPDALLTLVLISPYLVMLAVLLWPKGERRHKRVLTGAEVQALYRITSERARQGQWN